MLVLPKPNPNIVVDASIVAKIFLPDESVINVSKLVGYEVDEIAPSIIKFEVSSLLAKHHRLGKLMQTDAHMMLELWTHYVSEEMIFIYPYEEYAKQAFTLACDLKHPFYDCCYLALAQIHNCPLITADKQLYERGKDFYSNILLVS